VVWIGSVATLVAMAVVAAVLTLWTADSRPTQDEVSHDMHAAHAQQNAGPVRHSHDDFFTNGGLYMPRTHCLMNEAGNPDWAWIIPLIVLSLGVIAAYIRIYLFWYKAYFAEEPRDRNPKLMDMAQMFLWCAVTAYAGSVMMFFWPGYRLVVVSMVFLNLWAWRFCFNLSGFRSAFKANRYRRLSELDLLTGLSSRSGIIRRLDETLMARPDNQQEISVLFLDFDRFKLINDSMGHDAGDKLLIQIAKRITDAVKAQAFDDNIQYHIGRLGGDEFVIVVEGCNDRDRIDALVIRLHDALTCTYSIDERTVNSSVSIGITSTRYDYASADTILRDADTAMYEAKRSGRARTVWFDQAMHDRVRDTIELEHDLRHAIERNELFLAYQPLIDLESGQVTGFEALIRWRHPERGLVGPDQFIPIAEESLLIRPIGRWVIREAVKQAKLWRNRFPELAQSVMNVNLSRIQFFDPDLIDYISDTLEEFELPNDALCLEITESTIMQDNETSIALLRQFRDLGILLAMDDFGTGYSSLSHLHEFPLDAIKIDRSFIANLSNNRDYAAVINAITALAGNLGFTVVAEGVETSEQVAELQALSCDKAQGYFFHKPAGPIVIGAYLSGREQRARDNAQTA